MPTFDTPEPITATVEIAAGAVRLVAASRADTAVEVRPRDGSRSHDLKAAEQVRVDFHNGALVVASQRGFSFPRRGAVVVDIALPTGSRLSSSVTSANVTAEGEYRDCTFASASGGLSVGSVTGNLKAETASGSVTAHVVADSADISTASGNVRLGEPGRHTKFRAASGSLIVGRLQGSLNAQTSSGDVTVTTAVSGNVSAQTGSGEVVIGIAEGTAAQLDLHTRSGTIRNSLHQSDGPVEGDDTVTVRAVTNSADVIVQRAADQKGTDIDYSFSTPE